MHGTSPASLVTTFLLAALLAGCSQEPLAANAEPVRDSVSGIERVETAEASAVLAFTAVPSPGPDRLCLLVGREGDGQDSVLAGSLFLVWDDQALAPELRVDAVGAQTASAEGGSPLMLAWKEDTGPASLPFLVEVSVVGAAVAIDKPLAFLVQVESSAPDIEVLQGPCT